MVAIKRLEKLHAGFVSAGRPFNDFYWDTAGEILETFRYGVMPQGDIWRRVSTIADSVMSAFNSMAEFPGQQHEKAYERHLQSLFAEALRLEPRNIPQQIESMHFYRHESKDSRGQGCNDRQIAVIYELYDDWRQDPRTKKWKRTIRKGQRANLRPDWVGRELKQPGSILGRFCPDPRVARQAQIDELSALREEYQAMILEAERQEVKHRRPTDSAPTENLDWDKVLNVEPPLSVDQIADLMGCHRDVVVAELDLRQRRDEERTEGLPGHYEEPQDTDPSKEYPVDPGPVEIPEGTEDVSEEPAGESLEDIVREYYGTMSVEEIAAFVGADISIVRHHVHQIEQEG